MLRAYKTLQAFECVKVNEIFNMLIYYIFLSTILLFNFLNIGKKRILIFSSILLTIIIGFRAVNIGSDTYGYTENYSMITGMEWSDVLDRQNVGFNIFQKILSLVFPNSSFVFLLTSSLIIVISLYFYLKESEDVTFSLIMIVSLGFLYFFMTGIRQTIAIAILLVAYRMLASRRFIMFASLCLLASTFHLTAIVFIIVWPISKIKFGKIYILMIPLTVAFSGFLYNFILKYTHTLFPDTKYILYGTEYTSSNNSVGLIIQLCIALVSFILLYSKVKSDKKAARYFSIYLIGIIFQAMTLYMAEFFRLSMYFSIIGCLLLPYAFKKSSFKDSSKIKILAVLVFVLYYIFFSGNIESYAPYKFNTIL